MVILSRIHDLVSDGLRFHCEEVLKSGTQPWVLERGGHDEIIHLVARERLQVQEEGVAIHLPLELRVEDDMHS
jgi:hypothetical protein